MAIISKISDFLSMDKSLWPKMAEVSNGAFFCTTELSTQGKMKWSLRKRNFKMVKVRKKVNIFLESVMKTVVYVRCTLCIRRIETFLKTLFLCHIPAKTTYMLF